METLSRLGGWLRAAWYALLSLGAIVLAAFSISAYRRKRDAAAARDEDEAIEVEKAGERGETDRVLDSFNRATKE